MATAHTRGRPNPNLGGLKNLLAGPHGPGSPIFEELAKYTRDYTYFKEDFLGTTAAEAIGASKVFVFTESGASFVDPAKTTPTAALTSYITLDSGVTDDINANLATQKMFAAKFNPWWEMRFQVDTTYANATAETAFGFVDAVPASAADILGDIDTPTFAGGIADAAVVGVDTDQTLKTSAVQTIGTSTAVGKTTIDTGLGAPYTQPTINVDLTYRMELRCPTPNSSVSRVFFYINGQLVVERAGPDAEKLMSLVFQFGNRVNGQGPVWKVDYIAFGQEKSGAPF